MRNLLKPQVGDMIKIKPFEEFAHKIGEIFVSSPEWLPSICGKTLKVTDVHKVSSTVCDTFYEAIDENNNEVGFWIPIVAIEWYATPINDEIHDIRLRLEVENNDELDTFLHEIRIN